MALARAGYSVTAADALTFPAVHARTRLLAKQAPAFKNTVEITVSSCC